MGPLVFTKNCSEVSALVGQPIRLESCHVAENRTAQG